jgi:exopolyphosphatase
MSISNFLSKAKQSLKQSIQSKSKHRIAFAIGNESADLDSITCALVYGYIQSNTSHARETDKYVIPITNIRSNELHLRPELKALLKHAHLKPSDLITLDDLGGDFHHSLPPENTDWTLLDHNVFQGDLGTHYNGRVKGVIDHHADEGKAPQDGEPRVIEKTGSCCSHVVEYCRKAWDEMSKNASEVDAQLAKLALGAILIDTVNVKAEDKVTTYDRNAVEFLESKIAASPAPDSEYDRDAFFKDINDAKSNLDDLSLEEILRKDYKKWMDGNVALGISACVRPISYIRAKSESGDLMPQLIDFAKHQGDQLFAVMTAHNDNGQFERQMLLLCLKDGQPIKIAEKFVESNKEELGLEGSKEMLDGSKAPWFRLWEQKNLTASRKQVAPMIREAMKPS